MIKDLRVADNIVSWTFNGVVIQIKLNNVFFVSQVKDERAVKIQIGHNYIDSVVCYYSYDGNMILKYDLENSFIEWNFKGLQKRMTIESMKEVCLLLKKQLILILCSGAKKQEIMGYKMDGECIFKVCNPQDFIMRYFVKSQDKVMVVCDGNENYTDKFGRFQYNFYLDTNTGNLLKEGLAY